VTGRSARSGTDDAGICAFRRAWHPAPVDDQTVRHPVNSDDMVSFERAIREGFSMSAPTTYGG
jgi:hypothetical protein